MPAPEAVRNLPSRRAPLPKSLTVGLPLLLVLGVYLYHWVQVWTYAVDIPFWDEWDDIPRTTAWDWLWRQQGEHRMPTMKLLVTLMFHLNGWNMAVLQAVNFGIFGLVLVALYFVLRRGKHALPAGYALLLLVFPLSPRASEVHHWSITGHFHLAFLFLFGGIYLLFKEENGAQNTRHVFAGTLLGILSIYSFGSGLTAMLTATLFYALYKAWRARQEPVQRGREFKQLALVGGLIFLSLVAYAIGYHKPEGHMPPVPPFYWKFWDFWVTLISYGMGFRFGLDACYPIGVLYCVLLVLPWLLFIRQVHHGQTQWDSGSWTLLAGIVSITGALFGTTVGRAGFGFDQAQASRYTEITMMLIPLIGASWWLALANAPTPRTGVLTAYFALSALGFGLTWDSIKDYQTTYTARQQGVQHLGHCYAEGVACIVPDLYPEPIPVERLNEARAQNFSFMRKPPFQ